MGPLSEASPFFASDQQAKGAATAQKDFNALVILPVILTVVLACAGRNWLSPSTIYTLKRQLYT
jgi:ABC-type cobalamin transport system permease subunit